MSIISEGSGSEKAWVAEQSIRLSNDCFFEKVSLDTWVNFFDLVMCRLDWVEEAYQHIQLPARATRGSAGYDFYAPVNLNDLWLPSTYHGKSGKAGNSTCIIPTGIKVNLSGFHSSPFSVPYLQLVPRSSMGMKYGLRMMNTVGIIDADYYNNETNEGHILVGLEWDLWPEIHAGDRFCQGIILNACIDATPPLHNERMGGIGSTDADEIVKDNIKNRQIEFLLPTTPDTQQIDDVP